MCSCGRFEQPDPLSPKARQWLEADVLPFFSVASLAKRCARAQNFSLPAHHTDPLDRLLVAQALHEDCAIVTNDAMIARYPVNIIW